MECYLAFVDEIGVSTEGGWIYRFDFTMNTSVVWGEFFNIAPAAIVPDLEPDIKTLCKEFKVEFPERMLTAKNNTCFSMQDCIDGIIPLCFTNINEDTILINGKPLLFMFGEDYDAVLKKLNDIGVSIFDENDINIGDDSMLNNIINGNALNIDSMDNDGDLEE